MSVLLDLVEYAHRRALELPADGHDVLPRRSRPSFADAIRGRAQISVIAEFKRSSPSAGVLVTDRALESQLGQYEDAGAAAVSVLTEPTRFGGTAADLRSAAACIALPLLMKDFVVHTRQVTHAAQLGASAVLLIARCLDGGQLADLAAAATELGLDPLVECHNEDEVERALAIDSALLGINNRDLDTLEIDLDTAPRLLREIPRDRITIAESGYASPEQVQSVRGLADAVLVGTALLRTRTPATFIREVSS